MVSAELVQNINNLLVGYKSQKFRIPKKGGSIEPPEPPPPKSATADGYRQTDYSQIPIFPPTLSLDIDECTMDIDGCAQTCTNEPVGSFTCSCDAGYTLNADGKTCDGRSHVHNQQPHRMKHLCFKASI